MINSNKLRGLIAERGLYNYDVAKSIGVTTKTLHDKMVSGVFRSDEMSKLIEVLDIGNDPDRILAIFFAELAT